ncbi:MAG: IS4 family transposase [Acidobacteria bacterium]|nr:IS4 family transposase [Acidobacteriota bacterium]
MAEQEVEVDWSEKEFGAATLGDKRLNVRLVKLAGQFSKQPLSSINQGCEDWADAKAAYRFYDNRKVSEEAVLSPHLVRTQERMKAYKLVLAAQDTTELDYSNHPATIGLGPIGNHEGKAQGLMLHTSFAFSLEGLPLGILAQDVWSRECESRAEDKKRVSIYEKESGKWLKALEAVVNATPKEVEVVQLADREADVYEFLLRCEQLEARYVIRAAQDRKLDTETTLLWERLSQEKVAGVIEIEVAARANQPKRDVEASVRFARVVIKPPQRLKELRIEGWKAVAVWAVWVKERNPPAGVEPIEWMLLTNVEVSSFEDAVERIQWYGIRFSIEVYHKVLKSGCQVEAARLATAEKLKKHLALLCVVAWRLFWMTFLNRTNPDADCTMILAEHEWKALYCRIHKSKKLPEKVPTVREVVRWVARLGGFLGRKGDKEPGVTTVWRGWQRLTDIAEDWLIFNAN